MPRNSAPDTSFNRTIEGLINKFQKRIEEQDAFEKKKYDDLQSEKYRAGLHQDYETMMGTSPELVMQKLKNTGELEKQESANRGGLAIQQEDSSGKLGVEKETGNWQRDTSRITADAGMTNARVTADAHKYGADATAIASGTTLEDAKGKRDLLRGGSNQGSFAKHDPEKTGQSTTGTATTADPKKKKNGEETPDESTFWGRHSAMAKESDTTRAAQDRALGRGRYSGWLGRRAEDVATFVPRVAAEGAGWLSERKFWDE